MVSSAGYELLAQYNEWMNSRLYELCSTLPDDVLHRDQRAFFGSIYASLNHITYGDMAFMSRFTGTPAIVPELNKDLFGSFAELRVQREALDARILQWSRSLKSSWLAEPLTYMSKVDGKTRTVERWVLVLHMFNHQTHHRGQITTLLTQIGLDIGSTDIPFMERFHAVA